MSKRFGKWELPSFDASGMTKWHWMCQHHEGLKLGESVDIGAFSYINAKAGVTLEDLVQVGSHVSIYSVSTIDMRTGQVTLRKNARIGSHSVIMPGVTVGENSIVGAFSFVDKDIPPNVLAYGVPAKVIRELTADEASSGEQ